MQRTKNRAHNRFRITLLMGLGVAATCAGRAQSVSVIPMPAQVQVSSGSVLISDNASISYPKADGEAKFAAEHLIELLRRTRNLHLRAEATEGAAEVPLIRLERSSDSSDSANESYSLYVTPHGVKVVAGTGAGLYYGSVTLWQLLTALGNDSGQARLKCMTIHDHPELSWRGIMLDSARHMQSIAYIKQLIEWMSLEKLNTLHWHLTDDQGWRLEIKRYPRLTSVGAYRHLPAIFNSQSSSTLQDGVRYGGFYSQVQVRELVTYAAKRNVTMVPEIEMPGHASAALAAYPQFGSTSKSLHEPANHYGIFPYLYNIDDATFTFLENILTEVMDLFPSTYIHVGGDEAIKDQWKASPHIQKQMKKLGIQDEDALQSYFIKRIDSFLAAHHRRTVGWDEILAGGLAPNAAVMSWHGVAGGITAAKQGHDAVLTPVRPLYFNYRQTDAAAEAPGRFALNTLQEVYRFDPLPDTLTSSERKHIIGVQGNLWTEYLITDDRDTWMLFPRAAALAEIGWSPSRPRDWTNFSTRVVDEMQRYDKLGLVYDPMAFRVHAQTIASTADTVQFALSNRADFGAIHYSLDGSTVTQASPIYSGPLAVPTTTHVLAATFGDFRIPSSTMDETMDWQTLHHRYSQELKLCVTDPAIAMEQDPPLKVRPVMLTNYKNPCWIYKGASLADAGSITAGVAALPYLFRDKNHQLPPLASAKMHTGELQVMLDSCSGKVIAKLSLQPADGKLGVTHISGKLPKLEGQHDLCISIVRPTLSPIWVLDDVQLNQTHVEASDH